MDLSSLIRLLAKRKWILVFVPFLAVVGAFLIQFFGEWKFRSTAQLATGITVSDDVIEDRSRFNAYEIQVTFINLMEQIKSRAVINQVSYRLLYHDLLGSEAPFRDPDPQRIEEELGGLPEQYRELYGQILRQKSDSLVSLDPANATDKSVDKLLELYGYDYESILKELDVGRLNISDYIELAFVSEGRNLSAFVVNTVCSEFIRYYTQMRTSKSNISLESLAGIVEQRRRYLDKKTDELRLFRSSNRMIDPRMENESRIRQIQQYETEVEAERQRMRGLELSLASLNVRYGQASTQSNDQLNAEIVDTRRRIDSFNDRYVLQGSTAQHLADSINKLRDKLKVLLARTTESARLTPAQVSDLKERRDQMQVDLEISRENLNSLNKVLASMRYGIGSQANKEAVSQALEKDIDVARTEYLAAQARYTDASGKLQTKRLSMVQVVKGEPAEKPESRKTLLFMIFSGILSFVICLFVIVILDLADTRIRTPDRLKSVTKIPVAGLIPKVAKGAETLTWEFFLRGAPTREMNILNHNLRKIRFEIETRRSQVFLVTSTQKGQGKTFAIMSLAHSLSLIRKRILIIDTNLRNNSLTRLIAPNGNLKQLLEHHSQVTRQLTDGGDRKDSSDERNYYGGGLISRTGNEMVDIIGSKMSQFSPSELYPAADFSVMIEWFKVRYDYIIMEGAALNDFSDSRELVRFADLVIPVFSAGASVAEEDKESVLFLRSLDQKLGPAVLNNYLPET